MTGQRRVIARVLSDADDHPDVEELYRRASARDPRISIATVYRTVRLFEERGILERRDFGGGRARYEATEHGHHHHLIDIDTGRVIEFSDAEHERVLQAIAARLGFDLVSHRLELFGRRQAARTRPPANGGTGEPGARAGARRNECTGPDGRDDADWRQPTPQRPGFGELRVGNLGVRIATTAAEIDAAQALRYRVFYQEMGARARREAAALRRDRDEFDAVADHLLVVDHAHRRRPGRRRRHLPADPRGRRRARSAGSIPPPNTTSPR